MFLIPKNLRVIVLESPYDQIQNPGIQALFGKIVALKIEGYRRVYPDGVLPVDSHDFIATHYLVCEEKPSGPEILMGYKNVTLSQCLRHRLAYPGLNVLRGSEGTEAHQQALQAILDRCSRDRTPLTYGSSWTISPAIPKGELKDFLKDLMTAMLVSSELEAGIPERVSCGGLRVKTDQYFQALGYRPLESRGAPLPPFAQGSLFGEQAIMLHCTRFSDRALALADRFAGLWQERFVFSAKKPPAATALPKAA
ncbi:MAG: hypothetical protein NDJ89_01745 [Oligoflexia bacterium]|nr:hypothetical protein [Oligoflexia bacterium]